MTENALLVLLPYWTPLMPPVGIASIKAKNNQIRPNHVLLLAHQIKIPALLDFNHLNY